MRFMYSRAIAGGAAADVAPRTTPADVPHEALVRVPSTLPNSDAVPRRMLLAAEGTAANTIGVEVWAQDDASNGALPPSPLDPDAKAARRFYNCTPGGALTVTVGEVLEFDALMPTEGLVYLRVTTAPAADGTLKMAFG